MCLVMMGCVFLGSKNFLQLVEHGEVLNAVHTKAWRFAPRINLTYGNVTGVESASRFASRERWRAWRAPRLTFRLIHCHISCLGLVWVLLPSSALESSRPSYEVRMPLTPTKCLMKESKPPRSFVVVVFMPHRACLP